MYNRSDGCLDQKSIQPIRDGSEHCPGEHLEMERQEFGKQYVGKRFEICLVYLLCGRSNICKDANDL